jgi:hypothetical protein
MYAECVVQCRRDGDLELHTASVWCSEHDATKEAHRLWNLDIYEAVRLLERQVTTTVRFVLNSEAIPQSTISECPPPVS